MCSWIIRGCTWNAGGDEWKNGIQTFITRNSKMSKAN